MIKRFCDTCGKELIDKAEIHKIRFFHLNPYGGLAEDVPTDGTVNDFTDAENMDFCDSCTEEIVNAILHKPARKVKQPIVPTAITAVTDESAKVEKTEAAEEPKKKPRVDIAKIWSLKDAGWPVGKIAQELGCSKQTVYNILHDNRPEMRTAYDAKAATCQTR